MVIQRVRTHLVRDRETEQFARLQTPCPGHSCGRPNADECVRPTVPVKVTLDVVRGPQPSPQSAAVRGRMRWIQSKCAGPWICSDGNHELCDFAMEGLGWPDRGRKKQVVAFANCHCTSATSPLQFYLSIPPYQAYDCIVRRSP